MTVDLPTVPASSTHDFTFSYLPAKPTGEPMVITLAVPPGWTAPVTAPAAQPSDAGFVSVSCPGCQPVVTHVAAPFQLSVADRTITISQFRLITTGNPGEVPYLTITYSRATAPGSAGTAAFDATEQTASRQDKRLPPVSIDPSPTITVACADGSGTVNVSPSHVTAASTSTLTFTYTPAGGCNLVNGAVSLTIPPDWTLPSTAPGTAGYVASSLGPHSVTTSGPAVTVRGVTLAAGQPFTITYSNAVAPAGATTSAFAAAEQSAPAGSLTRLLSPPQVTVRPLSTHSSGRPPTSSPAVTPSTPMTPPPTTGPPAQVTSTGVMTVSPGSIAAGHPSTLTFTYQPPGTGLPAAGEVLLTVPAGWTAPSEVPGTPGYISAAPGAARVSGRQILVTGAALAAGQPLTISYHPAAAPRAAGSSVFGASQRASTAAVLTALTDPPSVAITGPSPFHIPATVGFILLAAACAAGLAAARFLRRRRPRPPSPPPPAVNTVPHAGPPGAVTVQPSRTEATHSMRIEPHPAAAVTTIEESAP